jgi:hypothetical protein
LLDSGELVKAFAERGHPVMIAAPIQCRTFAGHPHLVAELKVMNPPPSRPLTS